MTNDAAVALSMGAFMLYTALVYALGYWDGVRHERKWWRP